VTVAPGVEPG